MRATIRVRPAVLADGRRLTELDRATWSPDVTPAPLWPEDADFFTRDGPDGVIVADDAGHLVGYLKLCRPTPLASNRHVLHVGGLAVDPARQGEGIGRVLLAAGSEEAVRRGARRLTLRVLGPNHAARALYRSCGFEVEGTLRDEFFLDGRFVDDVLMARRLV